MVEQWLSWLYVLFQQCIAWLESIEILDVSVIGIILAVFVIGVILDAVLFKA